MPLITQTNFLYYNHFLFHLDEFILIFNVVNGFAIKINSTQLAGITTKLIKTIDLSSLLRQLYVEYDIEDNLMI